MRLIVTALLFIINSNLINGQGDSIMYDPLKTGDGIYLSYDDFRKNKVITKEQVVSNIDKEQQEFIGKVMFGETFSYKQPDGQVVTMETKKAWGYFQNNTFYVNVNNDFYRVPVFGSISYFVANVTVVNVGFYDPRFGYSTGTTRTREIREFLMNYHNGSIQEFNMDRVEELLSRDAELYKEFKKLGRRKQRDQVYKYIRKYNELHPVYFLKQP
jgi:hypothetical protein